ncbi:MAG: NAD+ synthase [Thermoplasmata archaeon]|nr:NAD+ synthase [Thermoplasmata archaeon]
MNLEARAPAHAQEAIHAFLRAHALADGIDGAVVGLSGGIDSALVARLASDALGPSKVLGVLLPDSSYAPALLAETEAYGASLGIATERRSIDGIERSIRTVLPETTDRVAVGNVKARIRMMLVYAIAREHHRLVLGTGNKSELLLGYFTKWGDGGADLLPLGDLYKTGVRELAEDLGLPGPIRERPPTAGLWEGQTDEEDLGLPYERIDRILLGFERLLPDEEIARRTGESIATVVSIGARVRASRHKRRMPPIPKLSLRTIGLDWRE